MYSSVFCFWSCSLFWQNPTQLQKHCEACQTNTNSFHRCRDPVHGSGEVKHCWKLCRGAVAARLHTCPAVRTACVTRPLLTPTPLPSGWLVRDWLPCYLYRQDYFNSLHYSTERTHADEFHVFGFPGVTSASLYLCTATLRLRSRLWNNADKDAALVSKY